MPSSSLGFARDSVHQPQDNAIRKEEGQLTEAPAYQMGIVVHVCTDSILKVEQLLTYDADDRPLHHFRQLDMANTHSQQSED